MRLFAAVSALVLAMIAPARAVVVVAVPSNELTDFFATPYAVTLKGGPLYLINTDTVPHSVVSYESRADGSAPWCTEYDGGQCPLFRSEEVERGPTEVLGLEATTGGGRQYLFYCGVHPWMHGTLIVG